MKIGSTKTILLEMTDKEASFLEEVLEDLSFASHWSDEKNAFLHDLHTDLEIELGGE